MISFQGRTYYRDKATGYHKTRSNTGPRRYLHRDTYSSEYGNIPHGWQVHHCDGDPDNNDLANLKAMPHVTHVRLHMQPEPYTCQHCGKAGMSYRHAKKLYCDETCRQKFIYQRKKATGTRWHDLKRKSDG